MARVYDGVGKAWAKYNERGEGRGHKRSKRVSFDGAYFYSYYTMVACYHTGVGGRKYVTVSSGKWSKSTSQHQSHAAWAANVPVFWVPHISSGMQDDNMDCLVRDFLADVATAKAAWKGNSWSYSDERVESTLRDKWDKLARYKHITGASVDLPNFQQILIEVDTHRQRARAEFYAPKAVERRERTKARREAKKALNLAE